MAKDSEYAKALDQLEKLRAEGQIGQGKYEVQRARLLQELHANHSPLKVVFRVIGIVIIAIVLLTIVGAVVNM